jgi:glucose-1-phosphate cytidylyltransferase
MNIFSIQGFKDFVIATGYKHEVIENWVNTFENKEDWTIDPLFTGNETQTGGRIKRCLEKYPNQKVIVTYGDGLGNVNINKLIEFHNSHKKLATVTAVRPPARFGYLHIENKKVTHFGEKNQSDEGWINGGFFVIDPKVSNFIINDSDLFETGALPKLSELSELMAYTHLGFWQPMDTLREKNQLIEFWNSGDKPWLKIK